MVWRMLSHCFNPILSCTTAHSISVSLTLSPNLPSLSLWSPPLPPDHVGPAGSVSAVVSCFPGLTGCLAYSCQSASWHLLLFCVDGSVCHCMFILFVTRTFLMYLFFWDLLNICSLGVNHFCFRVRWMFHLVVQYLYICTLATLLLHSHSLYHIGTVVHIYRICVGTLVHIFYIKWYDMI